MSGIRRMTTVAARGMAACAVVAVIGALAASPATAQESSNASVWVAPEAPAHQPNPVPVTNDAVARGRGLFRANCEMCHGQHGRGDGQIAGSLPVHPADLTSDRVQSQTDGALFWKITEGRGPMPSARSTLTPAGRWAVIDYIRSLKANK
ncbi:MAG: c-type cytochrome [Gemmatimonadaceae bacterium]